MSDIKRIVGCNHTVERMNEWITQGACPICLTRSNGMKQDDIDKLRVRYGTEIAKNVSLQLWWDQNKEKLAAANALLEEAQKIVDGALCLSVKKTGTEWTHADLCSRISAYLAQQGSEADAPPSQ